MPMLPSHPADWLTRVTRMNIESSLSRALIVASLLILVPNAYSTVYLFGIQQDKPQTDGRGMSVVKGNVSSLPGSSKRFALVIGVDDYQDTQINKLDGATNDAKA